MPSIFILWKSHTSLIAPFSTRDLLPLSISTSVNSSSPNTGFNWIASNAIIYQFFCTRKYNLIFKMKKICFLNEKLHEKLRFNKKIVESLFNKRHRNIWHFQSWALHRVRCGCFWLTSAWLTCWKILFVLKFDRRTLVKMVSQRNCKKSR